MYFHPKGKRGEFIPKCHAFYKGNGEHDPRYVPNGRKVYLHHGRDDLAAEAWVTRDPKEHSDQKLRCTPFYNHRYGDIDSDLWFHIDFENLSNAELTLLLTALKPADEFRHRLGLGKPLGLGTVQVDIEGVFLIDRVARYAQDPLNAPRYHTVWRPPPSVRQSPWAWRYPTEAEHLSLASAPALGASPLPKRNPGLIDDETLKIVKCLGDPALVQAPVHTPTVVGHMPEESTFAWFVQNETAVGRKALPKVEPGSPLTVLRSYPRRR